MKIENLFGLTTKVSGGGGYVLIFKAILTNYCMKDLIVFVVKNGKLAPFFINFNNIAMSGV